MLINGIVCLPLASCIFKKFHDCGWIFSKLLGVAISSFVVWLLSYAKILKFTILNCYIILLLLLIVNFFIYIKNKEKLKIDEKKLSNILTTELLFIAMLIFWVCFRSYISYIDPSTEQFMNYGFMNVMMNSDYLPAQDIWLSGYNINYYYFGQYISTFLTKISFLQVNEGYNLLLAVVASFSFILPYTIAYNLGILLVDKISKKWHKIIPYSLAIITGLSICIGGTLYYPIYKWIFPDSSYRYTDAVRYIGYRPETNDKTITDIPSYSNVTKDLHAHYVDILFVFTTLALLLQLLMSDKEKKYKKQLITPIIFLLGFILGIQKMTNYWDFPIYLVVISVVLIANNLLKYKICKKTILTTLLQIIELVLFEELLTLPFSKDLYISATKVYFTHVMSPLYKFAVLWAFPILCVLANLGTIIYYLIKNKKTNFMDNLRNLKFSDVYIVLLGICALGLVILPEIIYLKDIYADEYKRANTMFKLTYQAYIMFSISTSYIIFKFIYEKGYAIKKVFAGILLSIQITTFTYGINAIDTITTDKISDDLSHSEYFIKENYLDDYEAIQWIKSNIDRDKIIVEHPAGSFTISSRISVFTANPTVLGWHGHEWVWRATKDYDSPEEENNRWTQIHSLYRNASTDYAKTLIDRYNISYIYIGNVEFEKYEDLNLDVLLNLGEIVYKKDKNYSKSPVYIVKVD